MGPSVTWLAGENKDRPGVHHDERGPPEGRHPGLGSPIALTSRRDYAKERIQGRPLTKIRDRVAIIQHLDVRRMLMTMKSCGRSHARFRLCDGCRYGSAHKHPDATERQRRQARVDLLIPVPGVGVLNWAWRLLPRGFKSTAAGMSRRRVPANTCATCARRPDLRGVPSASRPPIWSVGNSPWIEVRRWRELIQRCDVQTELTRADSAELMVIPDSGRPGSGAGDPMVRCRPLAGIPMSLRAASKLSDVDRFCLRRLADGAGCPGGQRRNSIPGKIRIPRR